MPDYFDDFDIQLTSEEELDYCDSQGESITYETLASRISDLKRAGYPIKSKYETVKNRYGELCPIKRYFLEDEETAS